MFIEKRKAGKNIKYYLVHSFREQGEVIKIRRYLGMDLSKNEISEKIKLAEIFIKEQLQEYKKIRDPLKTVLSVDELENLRSLEAKGSIKIKHLDEKEWKRFSERFSYDTNAIEGSRVTEKEVIDLIEHDKIPNKSSEDIAEARNVVEAINFIRKTKVHVSLALIKKIHKIVFKDSKIFAGEFRKKGEEVVVMDGAGRIIHRGASPSKVEGMLKKLISWYNNYKKMYPPILLAAVVHNQFENIHPFADGNGRVGRILLNNILIKNGMPPINIEYEHRGEYYNTLKEYDNGNIRPTIEFILKEYKNLKKNLR